MQLTDDSVKSLANIESNGTTRNGASSGEETMSNGNGYSNGVDNEETANGGLNTGYQGHDREEVTRLIIQSLYDLGYTNSARQLENESHYPLESSEVAAFRRAVLNGEWIKAERLLGGLDIQPQTNMNELLFDLRQQKFLEALEARELGRALQVLRTELTPLTEGSSVEKLHFLSSLMTLSPNDLKVRADWDGAAGISRRNLLRDLSFSVSPSVMIPEHRLATLLQQVKTSQVAKCLWHNTANSPSLYTDHECDKTQFPLATIEILHDHTDEVWFVQFSNDGTKLVTTSKDHSAIIWDVSNFEPIHILSEHSDGVAYAEWSPDDTKLITCSRDRNARLWDTKTGKCLHVLKPHIDPVSCCAWAPDGQSFVTGGMDKEMIVWNLKGVSIHKWTGPRVYDLAITPDGRHLVAICTEMKVHIYDFVTRVKEYEFTRDAILTSAKISKDSRHLLISLASEEAGLQGVELWDLNTLQLVRQFIGHKQSGFVIKSCFGGADENFVISGSEDSHIYVWHKENGTLMERLPGHKGMVNCVAWNPTNPYMFASAGDDHDVRIWSNTLPSSPISKGKEKLGSSLMLS